MRTWSIEAHSGSAAELHALDPDQGSGPRLWLLRATRPALVLGSTQSLSVVDAQAAAASGVDVTRRRSGGGAVWVHPDEVVWIDILLPRDDPAWSDDIGLSFLPVGLAWARALSRLGVEAPMVHQGPAQAGLWSSLICFGGVGPGEVLVGGRKAVGISQRRTRAGARFQCALLRHWDPHPWCPLLVNGPSAHDLVGVGVGVGFELSTHAVLAELVDALASTDLKRPSPD